MSNGRISTYYPETAEFKDPVLEARIAAAEASTDVNAAISPGGAARGTLEAAVSEKVATDTPYLIDVWIKENDAFRMSRSDFTPGVDSRDIIQSAVDAASGVEISGGSFGYSASGVALAGAGGRLSGARIHDNSTAGIVVTNTSVGASVRSCLIERSNYGLHDQSTGLHSGIVIHSNVIPKSTPGQSIGALSPKSDLIYSGNVVMGYGVGNDGVGGTPGAGVRRVGNITD